MPNNRFACLKGENNDRTKDITPKREININSKKNTFINNKQSKSKNHKHNNRTYNNNKTSDNKEKNLFTNKTTAQNVEIKINSTNDFPALKNTNKKTTSDSLEIENYSKIVTSEIHVEKEVVSKVQPGYVAISRVNGKSIFIYGYHNKKKSKIYTKEEIEQKQNRYKAHKIMENRRLYREELNDILGDISPYWNMYDYDYDEDNDYDDYWEESSDSDYDNPLDEY